MPPTTSSCSGKVRPAASARSASTTGASRTTPTPTSPTSRVSESRPTGCARCYAPTPRTTPSSGDLDFLLTLGQLFALVVYGQLILEQAELTSLDRYLLDEIFAILIQDFSAVATDLYGKTATTEEQAAWALSHLRRPVPDATRTAMVWDQVLALCGAYEMQP